MYDLDCPELSPRQREIGELIIQGKSNKEIAMKLDITEQTVKNHISTMFLKLNVSSRLAMGIELIKRGIVPIPGDIRFTAIQLAKSEMTRAVNKFLDQVENIVL
ncbi:MAG: hypothetical protein A9183_00765 [Dehalococcoides mccartyi]|uniref:helix-turn-helix domain-containing protein n=1 Tax=Dehalococcoides mccartyi TaxID=61435 RepID=UPI000805DD5E|nr:helix-turn-helix transcriptional regulator [Dehalococcoides mccartyi]OBW62940.1 MAG: hypothetical protein A9183_00765 [Dehalococcoides mccartyi]